MIKIILIAVAGALGSLSRYGFSQLTALYFPSRLGLATFLVNLVGCFLFGLLWKWSEAMTVFQVELRLILTAGFLGALTTYSTFAFESMEFIRDGRFCWAAVYMAGHLFLCLGASFLGLGLAR